MAIDARKRAERGVKDVAEALGNGAVKERLTGGLEGLKGVGGKLAEGAKDVGSRVGGTARGATVKVGRRVKRARRTIGYRIAGERPPKRGAKVVRGGLAVLAGAAAAFFLDPVSGKRRRHVARDKLTSFASGLAGRAGRTGRYVASTATGKIEALRHRRDGGPENDQVLAHKVESEVFQSDDIPKARISVNAERGVVFLRGQVDSPDKIAEIERRVRAIYGVRDVRNLMHLPGTPAPGTTQTPVR
ncbi:MAG: BON domain-containing protein [Actinomycetota bacterium]